MKYLTEFVEDVTSFNYHFVCYHIHHLVSIPEIWELPEEEGTPKVFISRDWGNAIWEPYFKTEFGRDYCLSNYNSSWIEQTGSEYYLRHINNAVADLLTLPTDQIMSQLTHLFLLALEINKLVDTYFPLSANALDDKVISLNSFDHSIRRVLKSHNYPPFGRVDRLYIDKQFIIAADAIAWRKSEAIHTLIFKVERASGASPDIELIKRSVDPSAKVIAIGRDKSEEGINKFNSMPLNEVRKWFIQLSQSNSKTGEQFLTGDQVEQFIKRAFIGDINVPIITINETNRGKGKIVGLFHLFFTHCTTHRDIKGKIDPAGNADRYVRLLTDNFDNWTFEQVEGNFRSGGAWKKPA